MPSLIDVKNLSIDTEQQVRYFAVIERIKYDYPLRFNLKLPEYQHLSQLIQDKAPFDKLIDYCKQLQQIHLERIECDQSQDSEDENEYDDED